VNGIPPAKSSGVDLKQLLPVLLLSGCMAAPPDGVSVAEEALGTVVQGVDRAGALSVAEATSLKSSYGIGWTGVYLGGPCSAGSGWTASGVTAIHKATGWGFLPIYVGQQSSNVCSKHTLTKAQGTTDGNEAVALLKSFQWPPNAHIPLALDLEEPTYEADAAGSLAYVGGFASAVSAGGYDVYVYSGYLGVNALAGAGFPITGVWTARWKQTNGSYVAGVDPASVPGVSATWTSRPSVWQYNSGPSVVGDMDFDSANFAMAPAPGAATSGPADPCLGLADGTYCGGDGIGGAMGTLYVCQGGAAAMKTVCAGGCKYNPPGTPDACNPAPPGGGTDGGTEVGSGGGGKSDTGAGAPATMGQNMSSGQDPGTMPAGCSYGGASQGASAAWLAILVLLAFALRRRA
jgi:MYXO-CTERM domain-containing protein